MCTRIRVWLKAVRKMKIIFRASETQKGLPPVTKYLGMEMVFDVSVK